MKKSFFRILFSVFFTFILFFSIFFPVLAESTIDATKEDYRPEITVDIGGFNSKESFNMPSPSSCSGDNCVSIDWLANYVAVIYQYGIGLAGILAATMILLGGFFWLTSFGAPDRVSKAKEYITGALTGLLLALFSYLILYTINPALVSNQALVVSGVKPIHTHNLCCQKSDNTYALETITGGFCASGEKPVSDDLCKSNQEICEGKGGIYQEVSSYTAVAVDAHLTMCEEECEKRGLTAGEISSELMGPATRSGFKACCICGSKNLEDPIGCCYRKWRLTGSEAWVCKEKSVCEEWEPLWTSKFKEIDRECTEDYCETLTY